MRIQVTILPDCKACVPQGIGIAAIVFLAALLPARGNDFAARCADRTAIERVYFHHRLGEKPPFEQSLPPAMVEKLVLRDLRKEAALEMIYKVKITPAMVAAEVERIDATTRAPGVLLEIKHALGDDPGRFALCLAKPAVVERELRQRFDNDAKLHAAQRRAADHARADLLAKVPVGNLHELSWQLGSRPPVEDSSARLSTPIPTQASAKSQAYSNDATAQLSQRIASPGKDASYFEDLNPALQGVLRAQLQKPGDVSAVIETLVGFLVFQAEEKSAETLRVSCFSAPKRSYDDWLSQQADPTP